MSHTRLGEDCACFSVKMLFPSDGISAGDERMTRRGRELTDVNDLIHFGLVIARLRCRNRTKGKWGRVAKLHRPPSLARCVPRRRARKLIRSPRAKRQSGKPVEKLVIPSFFPPKLSLLLLKRTQLLAPLLRSSYYSTAPSPIMSAKA